MRSEAPPGMEAQTTRPASRRDLFAEDFDLPPVRAAAPPAEPEPAAPDPVFTADDLAAARADGFVAGEAAGRDAAATDEAARAAAALAAIAAHLATAAEAANAVADAAAEAIAQTVLAGLAAAFPRLSARFGATEVAALVQRILPALRTEPRVAIHLAPSALDGVQAVLARLDPDHRDRIRLMPDDALDAGDVRLAWENGEAVRDGAGLWDEIEAILAPAGLMPPTDPRIPGRTTPDATAGTARLPSSVVPPDLPPAATRVAPSVRSPDVPAADPRPSRSPVGPQRVKEPALGH